MNSVSAVVEKGPAITEVILNQTHSSGAFIGGGFALEQGFLYSAMIWAAIVVYIVDREFKRAAFWSLTGAVLSILGLMHSFQLTGNDSIIHLPLIQLLSGDAPELSTLFPAWEYAVGYSLVGFILLLTPWVTRAELQADQ
jgi:AGZA family xanthine/uracil permease-like MFS transporter